MDILLQLFIFCYLLISSAFQVAVAADALDPNKNLTHGQTLISSNQRFELGFFNLGNSTNSFLGIWYHNIPLTVIWVANKNSPLTNSSGHLVMTSNGMLLLYNGSMGIVWSTNQTVPGGNSPALQLLSSGNLVVRNEDDDSADYAWQSFDCISDNHLPGMKLGWNLRTRTNTYMRSWRNSEDPSDGEYTYSLDTPELPQLIIRRGLVKEYRWGPYDGDLFSGAGARIFRSNGVFTPRLVSNLDELYMAYEVLDEMTLVRFVLTSDGLVQILTWRNGSTEWNVVLIINRLYCDRYSMCGPYGNCYEVEPNCRCLKGFMPQSPQKWQVFDKLDGCRRVHELNCSDGDGFVKYDRLKLPDNAVVWVNMSQEMCRTECLRNCNCMAYTMSNIYGHGSHCLVWNSKFIDLRDVPVGGKEIHIRMARSELESIAARKRKAVMTRVVIIISGILFILLLALGYWYACRVKRKRTKVQDRELELPLFTLDVILAATKNFSSDNKIGQGGFGPVYKGELPNSLEIAVKRLSQDSGQGLQEFKNEVILIAKLQHRNLVRLLGCCIEGDEQMLVYEYLSNKSLDRFISDPLRSDSLPWSKRFSIILGIGRGLLYLHEDSRLTIIHRDLKTSNILLDSDMNPKISDFGIARIFGGEQTEEKTKRVIGTHGYMSPEYMMRGQFSVKSDVFSYGVIVLEIVSGKSNWGFSHPDHDYNLVGHAWKLWNESNCLELADEMGGDSVSVSEVVRCIQVALLCVQHRPKDRPTMSCVVSMLNNETAELPQPNEPGFCVGMCSMGTTSSHNGVNNCTVNAMTITQISGR